jgi:hypothetical protein
MKYSGCFGIGSDGTKQSICSPIESPCKPLHSKKKVIRGASSGSLLDVCVGGRGKIAIHPIRCNGIAFVIATRTKSEVIRQTVISVTPIKNAAQLQLFHIADATDSLRPQFGLAQRRQQHRREDGDDGDDHQQFNQGEARK